MFDKNTDVGMLIDRMIELIGNGDKEEGRKIMSTRGSPCEAKSFVGLTFRWHLEEIPPIREGDTSRLVLLPTKYLGTSEVTETGR